MTSFILRLFKHNPIKKYQEFVVLINSKEKEFEKLKSEELVQQSENLQEKIRQGEVLDKILPDAFALVREAAKRTLKQRHFDVQLIGGIVLHEGKIAEMLTGEGKTLAATLSVYLNALTGNGVHIVTVNDYLARRDAVWMGQIYNILGLKTGCLVHDTAYIYDSTYQGVNSKSDLPADLSAKALASAEALAKEGILNPVPTGHLLKEEKQIQNSKIQNDLDKERDILGGFKVVQEFLRPVSRKEAYAADIIYGTNHEFGFDYLRDNLVLSQSQKVQRQHNFVIIDEIDSILIDEARTPLIISAPDSQSSEFYKIFARICERLEENKDYVVDEKLKTASITEIGIDKVEKALNITNIFSPENARLVHFLHESLKAKALFKKDRDYVVKNGEVVIVDEFTGRLLFGRRYSAGLHQAIEAKENVFVKEENRTYATITIQNYFRLYKKISGMTGTAQTSAEEFHKVYNLEVVSIPANKPMIREDLPDAIFKNKDAKYRAVIDEVKIRHKKGQPILLGTTSIVNNEIISDLLRKAGIKHEVLNAKNHEREGEIIAQAGRLGAVTVATNMAGRGVDIVLGGNPPFIEEANKARESGGLFVLGTERHEARRIDNQLRGRAGRQGDHGSSQFFLSLEDDLLRIFGGERIQRLMETLRFPEDLPIESKIVSKSVNQAQARVEGANFDLRRHLLDFDDVLNKQRSAIYTKRAEIISAVDKNEIMPFVKQTLLAYADAFQKVQTDFSESEEEEKEIQEEKLNADIIRERVEKMPSEIEKERMFIIGQGLLRLIDTLWIAHLENLESLRESVNIRAYGQHEPLVEYRREAHKLFKELNLNFGSLVFNSISQILQADLSKIQTKEKQAPSPNVKKVGRNEPCWCGAKHSDGRIKKFKHCHGA